MRHVSSGKLTNKLDRKEIHKLRKYYILCKNDAGDLMMIIQSSPRVYFLRGNGHHG